MEERLTKAEYQWHAERAARQRAEAEHVRVAVERAALERRLDTALKEPEVLREQIRIATGQGDATVAVELVGVLDAPGDAPQNRCCFRVGPETAPWRTCGTLPLEIQELALWQAKGGAALSAALAAPKARVTIRQAPTASYRVGERLQRLLQSRAVEGSVSLEVTRDAWPPRACEATP